MSDTFAVSRKLTDLAPGIAVEVDPPEAERLGVFREAALDEEPEAAGDE